MIREAITLVEKYINNSSSFKEWSMMSDGYMPLTPSIMKEFQKPIDLAYHACDEAGLKTLKELQGSKNQISTFRRGGKGIAIGARSETQFIVELKGISSFWADVDIYSQISRNGNKWLDPKMTDKDYVVNNKFSTPMRKKMIKYFDVKDRFEVKNVVSELDGKTKNKFIKWYFDEAKKLINKKLLDEIRVSIAKKHRGDWNNDEYFLHNIEILGVWVVDPGGDELESEDNERKIEAHRQYATDFLKLNYLGFIDKKDIEKLNSNKDMKIK